MNLLGRAILPLWIRRGNPAKSPELRVASLFEAILVLGRKEPLAAFRLILCDWLDPQGVSPERSRPVTRIRNV
jgi:hypothetical protein